MKKEIDVLFAGSWAIFDHLFEVKQLPNCGDTVKITTPVSEADKVYWGGCSFNSAVTMAKLGLKSSVLAVEGGNFESSGYKEYLTAQGVDLSGTIILADEYSGHSFIFADPKGQSLIFSNIGASKRQNEFKPELRNIQSAKAIVAAPTFDEFTLASCKMAKENGLLVATNGALTLRPELAESFVKIVDIIFCNQFEVNSLKDLLGLTHESDLFKFGLNSMFVTCGKEGCYLLTKNDCSKIPSVPAKVFVDPTGAGDAFVGGTLTGIIRGFDYETAGRIGAAVASFVVEKKGPQTNLPDWISMQRRYKDHFKQTLI